MGPPFPRRLARAGAAALAGCLILAAAVGSAGRPAALASARAEDGGWDAEFEAVCSRTQDAMTLSTETLESLVERCDRLVPGLAGLDDSRRKVYARRLKQCRDLYAFVLETRGGGPGT
jgi:hypothetical protein